MIIALVAIGIAVLLGARVLWLQKQVEALVAAKLLEGQTLQDVPAWQISGKTASRVIGLGFLVAASGLAAVILWWTSPIAPETLSVLKGVGGIIGGLVVGGMALLGIIGLFGGMD